MQVPLSAFSTVCSSDHESHPYIRIGFHRHSKNLQFGESADGGSPNFTNGVNGCPCMGFYTLNFMLSVCVGSEIGQVILELSAICLLILT